MTTVRIFAATHPGSVRRGNEDAYGATSLIASRVAGEVVSAAVSNEPCLIVVADGLGGHPCGEVASQLAVEHLLEAKPTDAPSLVDAVQAANESIVAAMSHDDGSIGMGSTIAAVLVHEAGVVVVNVGDSAVFELVDDRLVQVSKDDVPVGRTSLPGVPSSIVTQTLGGGHELVAVEPHRYEDDLVSPRRLLLCTDGLTNFVPRDQLADALRRHSGEDAVRVLIALALAAGGPDNVTVMTLDVDPGRQDEETT
jgi:serine/threonine protein phosphatase PrpC